MYLESTSYVWYKHSCNKMTWQIPSLPSTPAIRDETGCKDFEFCNLITISEQFLD